MNCAPSWTVRSWASSHAQPGYDCSKTSGSKLKSSKTRRPTANASRSSWATNLYRLAGRTPACSLLTQASSLLLRGGWRPSPSYLEARVLATLHLVSLLDTPNRGPGVEADQLAALGNNASVANPKQYSVCVGGRAVGVAYPDALSNPGLGYLLLRHRLRHRRLPAWPPATTTA